MTESGDGREGRKRKGGEMEGEGREGTCVCACAWMCVCVCVCVCVYVGYTLCPSLRLCGLLSSSEGCFCQSKLWPQGFLGHDSIGVYVDTSLIGTHLQPVPNTL